jgi:hypothetical protein
MAGAFGIVFVLVRMGRSERLGAHPFWVVKTGRVGGALGAGLALVLILVRVPPRWCLMLGVAGTVSAYAEDMLSGRCWHFGWIATSAALVIAL